MAERDISGRAAQKAAQLAFGTTKRLKALFPLGPSQVRMPPHEARRMLARGKPGMLRDVMDRLGPEQALELLLGAQPQRPGPTSIDEYLDDNG